MTQKFILRTTIPLPNAQTEKTRWNLQSGSPEGCMGEKSASGGLKTSPTIEEMPTVSYSRKNYLPERLCEPSALTVFFAEGRDLLACWHPPLHL